MPDLDEGDLLYMPTTFPAIAIGKAVEIMQQTDKLIRMVPEVQRVFGKVGRAETATDPAPLSMIETAIQLKPRSEWRPGLTTADLIAELDRTVRAAGPEQRLGDADQEPDQHAGDRHQNAAGHQGGRQRSGGRSSRSASGWNRSSAPFPARRRSIPNGWLAVGMSISPSTAWPPPGWV
jgi:hypothetical protein